MVDDTEGGAEELEGSEGTVVTATDLADLEGVDDGESRADAPTGNKWADRRSLSELLEESDADKAKGTDASSSKKSTTPTVDDGDDEDDDELEEKEELAGKKKDEAPKPDAAKDAEQAKKGEGAAKETAKARYTVKGADGKAFAFELQPGTAIQFKADGRDVEVKSMDDLVQLAQKGAAYDRKTTEQGQAIATLKTRETELQESLKNTRATAEQTLLAALFDKDMRIKLRAALAPYRDPEYRKGIEAQQKLAAKEEVEQSTEAQQLEEKRTEFWSGVGGDIREEITSGKYEHLTADDAMEVATRFHAGYAQTFAAKFQELTAAGTPEAKAHEQANQHAFSHFTEKNLRRVMRGLNAELAEERTAAGKRKPAGQGRDPKAKPADERAGKAAADAHNKKLTDKLEQRRRAPRLQGGGAAPGGSARTPAPNGGKPRSFAQRMDNAFSLLRNGDDD